jgi:hypothetical protein
MASERSDHRSFVFSFLTREHGWAEADFLAPEGPAHFSLSYLADALTQLLDAVDAILAGENSASAWWGEEPGFFRWEFQRDRSALNLRIWVEDGTAGSWFGPERDHLNDQGPHDQKGHLHLPEKLLLSTHGSVDAIMAGIALGAERALLELGEVQYWVRWQHPFPIERLRSVRSQLGMDQRTPDKDDKYDPLITEMIRRWSRFLFARQDVEGMGPWAQDQFLNYRDELAFEGLHFMNDAALHHVDGENTRPTDWANFMKWRGEVKRFGENPDGWNREYYRAYFARLVRDLPEEKLPRYIRNFTTLLSAEDIAEVIANRPETP